MHDATAVPVWILARNKVNIEAVMSLGAGVVREEMDLYTTKWFDYRFISPTEATDLFKSEYRRLLRSDGVSIRIGTKQNLRAAYLKFLNSISQAARIQLT